MNEFKKYLGAILIIIAAIVLICSYFYGWNNYNWVQFSAMGLMIVGLIVYIIMNKRD
ncbi:MAG: hypothetical protein J6V02_03245 [Bacteroidaceae bacterium]|nr:hypothetical protein [Bacteroidaceae bacterium]